MYFLLLHKFVFHYQDFDWDEIENDPKRIAEDIVFNACELASDEDMIDECERALEIDPECLRALDVLSYTYFKRAFGGVLLQGICFFRSHWSIVRMSSP